MTLIGWMKLTLKSKMLGNNHCKSPRVINTDIAKAFSPALGLHQNRIYGLKDFPDAIAVEFFPATGGFCVVHKFVTR